MLDVNDSNVILKDPGALVRKYFFYWVAVLLIRINSNQALLVFFSLLDYEENRDEDEAWAGAQPWLVLYLKQLPALLFFCQQLLIDSLVVQSLFEGFFFPVFSVFTLSTWSFLPFEHVKKAIISLMLSRVDKVLSVLFNVHALYHRSELVSDPLQTLCLSGRQNRQRVLSNTSE